MMKPKTLKNGMRVHLVPFSGTEAATVLVLTKVGSRYETERVLGGSHFIEHLMFKGTKRRPNTIDISKTLDRYGAEFNAYTGKDLTGYYVKIAGEKLPVAVDLLHDMLFHSKYDSKEIRREKGVILEEMKMYEENPIMHLEDLLEQAMFDGNPLGQEIIGTEESITKMRRTDLIAYRDQYYRPSEMVIVVAGKIPRGIMMELEKTFGRVKKGKEPASYLPFGDTPSRKTPRVERQYKPLKQIQLGFGFPTVGRAHKDIPAIKILATILGGSMSSRLFIEVRERRGLCYAIRVSADAYDDVGTFVVRAGLDADRLELASKTIMRELRKIKKHGISAKELREAKDHIAGATKLKLENSSARATFIGRQELYLDKVQTVEERMKAFEKVKKQDVDLVAKEMLDFGKLSIAAIGPYKSDKALLKQIGEVHS